jgi:copper chaperone
LFDSHIRPGFGGIKMEKTIINVEGMSCQHCVKAVTNALEALPGVSSVTVELEAKTAAVEYDPSLVTLEKMKNEIEEQGYSVVS